MAEAALAFLLFGAVFVTPIFAFGVVSATIMASAAEALLVGPIEGEKV